jgi:signal transduction histidine kinase
MNLRPPHERQINNWFADLELKHRILQEENARLLKDIEALHRQLENEQEVQREIVETNTILEKSQTASEQTLRAKDRFLASVSHEMRTPLSVIIGWLTMMHTNKDSAFRERALEIIERNAILQLKLTEDLIDFSRAVTGNLRIEKSNVDIALVAGQILQSVEPLMNSKQLTLVTDLEQGPISIFGDRVRLGQILTNLLSNAVKFSEAGGRIDVGVHRRDMVCEIAVKDNGRGISLDFLPRVFDLFAQDTSEPTRSGSGLGLGLALVKQLSAAHNGTVTAESIGPGKGATFRVCLPIVPD